MKNKLQIVLLVFTAFFFFASMASAKALPPFQELNPTTVKAASTMSDNTIVTLTGKISAKYNVEEYQFQDASGVIAVEFDDDDIPMGGFAVGTKMKIMGEVDKEVMSTKIDVKNYQLIK